MFPLPYLGIYKQTTRKMLRQANIILYDCRRRQIAGTNTQISAGANYSLLTVILSMEMMVNLQNVNIS